MESSSQPHSQLHQDRFAGSTSMQDSKKKTTFLFDKENAVNEASAIGSVSRSAVSASTRDARRPVFGSSVLPLKNKPSRSVPPIATTIPETPQPFHLHRTPLATTSSGTQRTPYSILSLELNHRHSTPLIDDIDEDDDELLLFSPLPPATKPPRPRPQPTRLSSPPERVPVHHHASVADMEEPDPQMAVFVTKSTDAVAASRPQTTGHLPPMPKKQEHFQSKPSVSFIKPPKQKPSFSAIVETPVLRNVMDSISSTASTTPWEFMATTTKQANSNSVCMDLANVFMEAAPSTKPSFPPNVARTVATDGDATTTQSVDATRVRPGDEYTMSHDDDPWAEKQVELFTKWLNFLFYPADDRSSSATHTIRTALRSLALHQQTAQRRRKAMVLFHSAELQNLRDTVCQEVGRQRIALRKDRDLYANLDDRGKILSLLLSYSTPWLRLGLETMFHTTIQPDIVALRSPKPVTAQTQTKRPFPLSRLKVCIKNFIIQHVLSDEQIQMKYTGGKCKVPSGQFEERYRAELRTIVVYRLLVLILFLDRAKMARLLDEDVPNLFVPTSTVKSTRAVLLTFCRGFLQAEGDFTKHLTRLGIHVHYQQKAMDELDFTVTNLRVDLNDGVRLTRMAELLTGCPPSQLISQLRLPAVSRLQKMHNVQLALDHLQQTGVPISNAVVSHHIVDGHREMVLKLLWSVVGHCCLQELLSVEQVHREIKRIEKLLGVTQRTVPSPCTECELPPVLMQWCNAICHHFDHPVTDWSSSFADGKAVCLLIHFYHPTLLRRKELRRTSRDPLAKYCRADVLLANERAHGMLANACISDLGGIPEVIPICDTLNPPDEETMVFAITFLCSRLIESSVEVRACLMIQHGYRRHRHRIRLTCQVKAAVQILQAWRWNRVNYYTNRQRRYGHAVRVIEAFIADHRAAIRILQLCRLQNEQVNLAAARIQVCDARGRVLLFALCTELRHVSHCLVFHCPQKHVRSLQARRRASSLIAQNLSVVYLQSKWRQALARRLTHHLIQRDRASRLIQWTWCTFQLHDARKNRAALQIQRIFRGYWYRVQFVIDILDIIAVQSCVRRYLVRREYSRMKSLRINQRYMAALLIQSRCLRWQAQKSFQCTQQRRHHELATISIQTRFRRWTARRLLSRMKLDVSARCSAVKIQSIWRMFQCRFALVRLKVAQRNDVAAVTIQSTFRRYQAQFALLKLRQDATLTRSAGIIQAIWRAYCIRTRWIATQFAATCLQAMVRRKNAIRRMRRAKGSAAIIQGAWRTFQARGFVRFRLIAIRRIQATGRMLISKLERYRRIYATLQLQCLVRKCLAVRQVRQLRQRHLCRQVAAIDIQRHLRGSLTFAKFQLLKQDAVMIQKTYRRCRVFHCYQQKKTVIVPLQSFVRRFLAQQYRRTLHVEKMKMDNHRAKAIVFLQAIFRGSIVRKALEHERCAAVAIQSLIRGHVIQRCFVRSIWNIIMSQAIVRRWLAYRRTSSLRHSLLCIQCTARRFFARRQRLSLIARKYRAALERHSALTIQRVFRGMKGRQLSVKECSARMIQKTWRCYTVHVEYMLSILAAMDIQAVIRRHIAFTAYEYQYAAVVCIQSFSRLVLAKIQLRREEKCAVIIQSFSRMVSRRTAFVNKRIENASAILIQNNIRMYMTRSNFLYWKYEATKLQRCVRGHLTRLQLRILRIAATEIQRIWLGFVAREFLAWKLLAVIRLQSFFRSVSARNLVDRVKEEKVAFHHLCVCCATKIQCAFRVFVHQRKLIVAATVVERAVLRFLSRNTFGKVRRGVVRVQCLARGHTVRRYRSKKLNHHASRIAAATEMALRNPSMKLSCRTQSSLDILRASKSLSEIMTSVCVLEMATRLSQVCCETFVQARAPDVLFSLIHTCNRSLPHIALLQYILLTLTNVARFDALVPSLATVKGVEIFLDLVQMFRDKELVFCLVAKLLERVVRSNEEVLVRSPVPLRPVIFVCYIVSLL
jgi:abnormal spindle-like microcephaly-associated protein